MHRQHDLQKSDMIFKITHKKSKRSENTLNQGKSDLAGQKVDFVTEINAFLSKKQIIE